MNYEFNCQQSANKQTVTSCLVRIAIKSEKMNYNGHFVTYTELANMHLILGRCDRNSSAAARLYAEMFPKNVHPGRRFFDSLHRKLCEKGSFEVKKEGSGRKVSCNRSQLIFS
jgi:hypothetical protein